MILAHLASMVIIIFRNNKGISMNPKFIDLLKNPIHLLAFGFGSGLASKAPGTFGTLMAVPLFVLMMQLNLLGYILVTIIVILIGFYLCGKTAKDLDVHDHSGIVWDEFAGFFVTMLPLQAIGSVDDVDFWLVTLLGFMVFRLFDVLKPWPIIWFDKNVHGGLGIMIDDLVAAMASLAVVQAVIYGGL